MSLGLEKVVEKGVVRNRGGEKDKDYVGRLGGTGLKEVGGKVPRSRAEVIGWMLKPIKRIRWAWPVWLSAAEHGPMTQVVMLTSQMTRC